MAPGRISERQRFGCHRLQNGFVGWTPDAIWIREIVQRRILEKPAESFQFARGQLVIGHQPFDSRLSGASRDIALATRFKPRDRRTASRSLGSPFILAIS